MTRMRFRPAPLLGLLLALAAPAAPAVGSEPDILNVRVEKVGMLWNVHVTLRHPDTGWDHYADGWEVLATSGNRLGYRKLMHPHVTEQPFTRSLSGIVIPDGAQKVLIKARCSLDGWAGEPVAVALSP